MVYSKIFMLSASAGLVAARPAWWPFEGAHHNYHHHHHDELSYSFSLPPFTTYPIVGPTGTRGGISVGTGTGTFPTGTGVPSPAATGSVAVTKTSNKSSSSKTSSSSAISSSTSSTSAASDCTFTDADTALSSKASCSSIILNGITVPAGTTLDMTGLADDTTVTFQGTTTFEYQEWEGPLISFSGSGLTITGAPGHVIDGNGAKWWDGKGSNGGKTKPKFFYAHKLTNSVISGLNVKNTPVQGFSINGAENLSVKNVTIDNTDGASLGHNTDAFDVGSSTGVHISGANVKNQDDCLAINSGTDISFTGGSCSGGHGLSIGSVGGRDDNDVANVHIADSTISDSQNGVRIKTVYNTSGSVKNVTYSSITLSGITNYGIVIEQDYENGSPTGKPTSGVPITDLTVKDITGTVTGDGEDVYILCASGACSGWTWSGVSVGGGKKSSDCANVPDEASC